MRAFLRHELTDRARPAHRPPCLPYCTIYSSVPNPNAFCATWQAGEEEDEDDEDFEEEEEDDDDEDDEVPLPKRKRTGATLRGI